MGEHLKAFQSFLRCFERKKTPWCDFSFKAKLCLRGVANLVLVSFFPSAVLAAVILFERDLLTELTYVPSGTERCDVRCTSPQ